MTLIFEIKDPDLEPESIIKLNTHGHNQFPPSVELLIYNPNTDSYIDYWFSYEMLLDLKNKLNEFMNNCPDGKFFTEYIKLIQ